MVATDGYSIYIYHITLDEANRVRREMGLSELADNDCKLQNVNWGRGRAVASGQWSVASG